MVTTRGNQSAYADGPVVISERASPQGTTITDVDTKEEPQHRGLALANDEDFETVGSRIRKRRRIESSNDPSRSQPSKRAIRQRRSSPYADHPRQEASVLDEFRDRHEAPNAQIDPRLSDSTSRGTNTDDIEPTIAGLTLRKPHVDSGAGDIANKVGAEKETHLKDLSDEAGQPSTEPAPPDLSTVIDSIIKHGETIDEHYAAKGLNELGVVDTESFLPLGASVHLKIQSLPILENLSVQILNVLAKSTYQDIVTITEDPDSEPGQAYATLKSLFDHTKKVYSVHEPFLLSQELGLTERNQVETIRKANLATFVSSVFGGQDVGFYHLNEYFLDTFVGAGGRLLKTQAQLFLDLKTQAFISARSYGQRSKEELLSDIFPADMEERLLTWKGTSTSGSRLLAPSESEFLQRAQRRSQTLMRDPHYQDVDSLSRRYVWEDFLRDISNYVRKNFEPLIGQSMQKGGLSGRAPEYSNPVGAQDGQQAQSSQQPNLEQQSIPPIADGSISQRNRALAPGPMGTEVKHPSDAATHGFGFDGGISIESTADIQFQKPQPHEDGQYNDQIHTESDAVHNDVDHGLPAPPPAVQYNYPPPPTNVFYNNGSFPHVSHLQPQLDTVPVDMNIQQQLYGDQPINPHPTQSAPTQVLYERARQAATVKATPTSRRMGNPSQRRPWSHEEENALMAGLDRVKGPHWSQILAMFGPGGNINETLKDRNQVQLKDKARNLKLFFLKSGIEVPYYLQFVTGELKTRAPSQAARNEAKERENDSEERAHVEGVFALAYGPDSDQIPDHDSAVKANAGISHMQEAEIKDGNLESRLGDAGVDHNKGNEIAMQIANAAQGLTQRPLAPDVNVNHYSQENPVTPNFQAMVDLAVAEAARVSSGGG